MVFSNLKRSPNKACRQPPSARLEVANILQAAARTGGLVRPDCDEHGRGVKDGLPGISGGNIHQEKGLKKQPILLFNICMASDQ
jgi:hypothetical protein